LDSVTESFLEGDHQLSQLSVSTSVIESDDSWNLEKPIPVGEIINAFRVQKTLVQQGGQVFIPLHEDDSAELTGEYLIRSCVVDCWWRAVLRFYKVQLAWTTLPELT